MNSVKKQPKSTGLKYKKKTALAKTRTVEVFFKDGIHISMNEGWTAPYKSVSEVI